MKNFFILLFIFFLVAIALRDGNEEKRAPVQRGVPQEAPRNERESTTKEATPAPPQPTPLLHPDGVLEQDRISVEKESSDFYYEVIGQVEFILDYDDSKNGSGEIKFTCHARAENPGGYTWVLRSTSGTLLTLSRSGKQVGLMTNSRDAQDWALTGGGYKKSTKTIRFTASDAAAVGYICICCQWYEEGVTMREVKFRKNSLGTTKRIITHEERYPVDTFLAEYGDKLRSLTPETETFYPVGDWKVLRMP